MKKAITLALVLSFAAFLAQTAIAQQVGENVNILQVYQTGDPLDYLGGDLYGQRQGEPDIAFSSLNPDHGMAIYNDFRAVDVPNDPTPDSFGVLS